VVTRTNLRGRNETYSSNLGGYTQLLRLAVVNAESGSVVASYPIGDHADATAFDPAAKIAFTSTGDGNIFLFHQDSLDSYSALPVIPTVKGAKTMALDKKTRRLFVPARDGDHVALLIFAE
jgi:hypothetical protein